MRIHATILVFHNSHITTYSNKPQISFSNAIMPNRGKQRNQNAFSSGEEFSDVDPTVDTDDESAQPEDNWTFPEVPRKAKREEYETASKFPQCSLHLV